MIDLEERARALNEHAVADALPVETVLARARRYRARRRAIASALTACVVVAGIVAVAWATSGGGGIGGVHTVNSTVPAPTGDSPKVNAEHLAAELLDQALLPPSATPFSGQPPRDLAAPFMTRSTPNIVDVHRMWIVLESRDAVVTYIRTHQPTQLDPGQCCGTLSGGTGHLTVSTVSFFDSKAVEPKVATAELQVSIAARTATTTWVRADAQVVWRARRDPNERVSTADRVIVVTNHADKAAHPVVITDRVTVDRIERTFNALPVGVPGEHGCVMLPSGYTLKFSETKTSRPDVVASVECGDVSVTIHGRRFPPLEDAGLARLVAPFFKG